MKLSSIEVYLESSLVTFITAFLIAAAGSANTFTFTKDGLIAVAAAAARAGIKALLESLAVVTPTVISNPVVKVENTTMPGNIPPPPGA